MNKLKDPKELFDELGIDIKQGEKEWQAMKSTSAFEKINNYIIDLSKKSDFLKVVRKIRTDFEIPVNGFPYPKNIDEYTEIEEKYLMKDKFMQEVSHLSQTYDAIGFFEFFESYILFNNTQAVFDYTDTSASIIEITDMHRVFFEDKGNNNSGTNLEDELAYLKMQARTHPIGILIHPYMSQRDVIDAIKKIYKLQIEPLQKKYRKERIKLGTIRRKSKRVEERNKFIFENRTLSMPKLRTAIREKYHEILDETYIYKIIKQGRLENK